MDTYTQSVTPKRQYRSLELKQRIVEETLAKGASVALVARAHGVNANQVFTWRRQYRAGRLERAGANLLPVRVTPESSTGLRTPFRASDGMPSSLGGTIHIQLNHAHVSLGSGADPELLRVLLECLQR
jgi:transposase